MYPSVFAGEQGEQEQSDTLKRLRANSSQEITPYLGLRARLSQVWINRWTVLLLLVLVRVLLAVSNLDASLRSAKTEAMAACNGVEAMGSTMASMPHYLAAGVNELTATGVEKAVRGLMSILLLTVTGLEELIVFYISMLTSTYLCLVTLVVRGSLHIALQIIEDTSRFLNATLKGISHDIGSGIADFTNDLNTFTSKLNSIPEAFGDKKGGIPTININKSLDELTNLQLPSDLDHDLTKLNSSIPTFVDVQNFTDNIIRLPFEDVKKLINTSVHFAFDRTVLPVPSKETLIFCSDNNSIATFFSDVSDVVQVVRRVFIAVLIILAALVCIPAAYLEVRRWRIVQARAKLVRDESIDPLDVIYISSRPCTAAAGVKAATVFGNPRRQILIRWVIAYGTSTPALLLLSLGLSGLLACGCQLILVRAVQHEVPILANDVGEFASKVISSLDNASATWATDTNSAVLSINHKINDDVFGWVNTSTNAVNATLDAFIGEATKALNVTFANTILYEPVTELFDCLIGLKVASVQKGLTWVSDHAQVDLPLIPNNTFSLGASDTIPHKTSSSLESHDSSDNFLASPGSEPADGITGAVNRVTSNIVTAIRTEALISTVIILLWVVIVTTGFARAAYLNLRPIKVRGTGGTELKPQRPFSSIIRGPAPAYEPQQQHNNHSMDTMVCSILNKDDVSVNAEDQIGGAGSLRAAKSGHAYCSESGAIEDPFRDMS